MSLLVANLDVILNIINQHKRFGQDWRKVNVKAKKHPYTTITVVPVLGYPSMYKVVDGFFCVAAI
jgi:hypothetical protein